MLGEVVALGHLSLTRGDVYRLIVGAGFAEACADFFAFRGCRPCAGPAATLDQARAALFEPEETDQP